MGNKTNGQAGTKSANEKFMDDSTINSANVNSVLNRWRCAEIASLKVKVLKSLTLFCFKAHLI